MFKIESSETLLPRPLSRLLSPDCFNRLLCSVFIWSYYSGCLLHGFLDAHLLIHSRCERPTARILVGTVTGRKRKSNLLSLLSLFAGLSSLPFMSQLFRFLFWSFYIPPYFFPLAPSPPLFLLFSLFYRLLRKTTLTSLRPKQNSMSIPNWHSSFLLRSCERAARDINFHGVGSNGPHRRRRTHKSIVFARFAESRVCCPNGIAIGSAVYAGFTIVTNQQTDIPRHAVRCNSAHLWLCSMHAMRASHQSVIIDRFEGGNDVDLFVSRPTNEDLQQQ